MTPARGSTDRPTRVLIAGCGFLGRRVARKWHDANIDVSVLTRSHAKAGDLRASGFGVVEGDLAAGHLPDLPDVDTVLWTVGFDRSSRISRRTIWIDGLRRLITVLPDSVKRILYVSSTGVYGELRGETVDEDTVPSPATESGQCCLEAERLLRTLEQSRSSTPLETIVLRMAGIYGPNRLLRRTTDLRAGKPLPGNPTSWLNLIHVDDAAVAIAELAAAEAAPRLLNVVNSETLTRSEYYSELARLTESPDPVFAEAEGVGRTRGGNKRIVSRVRKSLDLPFQFDDVRDGLRDAVERSV